MTKTCRRLNWISTYIASTWIHTQCECLACEIRSQLGESHSSWSSSLKEVDFVIMLWLTLEWNNIKRLSCLVYINNTCTERNSVQTAVLENHRPSAMLVLVKVVNLIWSSHFEAHLFRQTALKDLFTSSNCWSVQDLERNLLKDCHSNGQWIRIRNCSRHFNLKPFREDLQWTVCNRYATTNSNVPYSPHYGL